MKGDHPRRDSVRLMDGAWWASQPFDDLAWMREAAPVYWDPVGEVWGVARYADLMTVEKDPATFSSMRAPRPHGNPMAMMISMDDPAHAQRRKLVSRGFTPRRVRDHTETISAICTTIIDRVCERGECDFVTDIATPLPLLLIADMLGFPPSSYDDLLRWSDQMLLATTVGDDAALEAAMMAAIEFREFQLGVIADRRSGGPTEDLIGVLCNAEIDGEQLDDESLIMESLLILIGGDETSRHVIADGMTALLEHPDQLALLQAEPDRMTVAVEELLRWVSPIKNMGRTVTTDCVLAGQQLAEGDQLMVIYPSANRDADVFDEPDRFDITRQPNPHVAFGFGPHFCLGASLARLELQILFTQVLERMGDLTLVTDPGPRRASNFISGPEHMPVRFTPSAPVGV